jgi:DNA helicase HerA-like ATPase
VTETIAVLAKRGSGKTNYDVVFAEELLRLGQQVVVVDPVGATWGLAYGANGSPSGGVLPLLGGDRGSELPDPKELASLVAVERESYAVDLSHMRRSDQVGWFALFAKELYFLKSPEDRRTPCHLVVEETDVFAPQRPDEVQRYSLDALEEIVRRGRSRGLGVTLSTQRASVLNKNVLTQVEMLVLLRMTSPQDRQAVREWVLVKGDEDEAYELLDSLPTLERGEAWFWSPGWLNLLRRAKVRHRQTFDSSKTPEARASTEATGIPYGPDLPAPGPIRPG